MKRIVSKLFGATLALVLASSMFTSCTKKEGTASSDPLSCLSQKGKLILGLDDSFPPLGFRDENNEIVGYDIDLAKEVAKRLGVELVCQPIDWSAKEQELATKKIDCIWNGFTMTPERKEAMAFTKPYLDNAQVAVVRTDGKTPFLTALAGKTVGIQAGSSAQDAVDAMPEFKESLGQIVELKENITALNDLTLGNLDAVIMDQVVAGYNIATSGKPLKILSEPLAHEEYGVAFRKQDTALRDKVQAILEEMQKDGTVTAISTKWFGTDLSVIGK
ncbi:MAG: amino acid ABC transporter substrate-binding protein [Treponema sp.]|nr:amino acid ABC transporter substrate-binding protein [Treponema sp.]MBP5746918.1 amino acid ABC transporter substrate-binding protein [Treponema sp.]MBR4386194.1 amino acid ABC transporter substrate-binding protein [Treponema sp.]MCR5318116.1 amino acid ABC transporter substrate-binding protein [Treponema sp.]